MGIGFRELIVILIIVLLIFGAKKLRSLGSDFGAAVKNFRESMKDGEQAAKDEQAKKDEAQRSDGQPPAK